jgi:hypothetical protein
MPINFKSFSPSSSRPNLRNLKKARAGGGEDVVAGKKAKRLGCVDDQSQARALTGDETLKKGDALLELDDGTTAKVGSADLELAALAAENGDAAQLTTALGLIADTRIQDELGVTTTDAAEIRAAKVILYAIEHPDILGNVAA